MFCNDRDMIDIWGLPPRGRRAVLLLLLRPVRLRSSVLTDALWWNLIAVLSYCSLDEWPGRVFLVIDGPVGCCLSKEIVVAGIFIKIDTFGLQAVESNQALIT
jgi:hypothetical protein